MELKKISILGLAKILALFGIAYGLVSGILLSFAYSKSEVLTAAGQQLPAMITGLGYWTILVMPILNGIVYFIAGIILAFLYNIFAGWIGGIKIEFAEKKK